jgi:hypothetical protein
MKRLKIKSPSHLSSDKPEAGISTWHLYSYKIGCYGIYGPVPYAVLDKIFIV